MEKIIEQLRLINKTIACMESCTGGGLANCITNIEGASDVFKFGAVTYSNEYKIKMGVPEEVIAKYTVYSMETASSMAKAIANFAQADYGVGITGKLNREDKNNITKYDNLVYICIYNKEENKFIEQTISLEPSSREESKSIIIFTIIHLLSKEIK